MKYLKIFSFTSLMCLVCQLSFAKDVIVTKQSEKIDAKIVEVSDEEVRYKKIGNLNGPTFVIKTKEISTVVYENGDIQTFKEQQTAEQFQEPIPLEASIIEQPETLPSQGEYVLYPIADWKMNGKTLSRDDLEAHLLNNCPKAYNQWKKGCDRVSAGVTFLVCGAVLEVSGLICLISYANSYVTDYSYYGSTSYYIKSDGLYAYGIAAGLIVGPICELASIPCLISGGVSRRKAIETYNEECVQSNNAFYIDLKIKSNGLGLALRF